MMRARRIAVVAACPFPYPRGTPIRIQRMAEAVAGLGHEVQVVTYHNGQPTDHLPFQVHRIRRVRTYRKLSPGPSYQKLLLLDPLLVVKLRQVIQEHAIELVHAHHFEGLLVAIAARRARRMPIVFDAHTLLESELPFYRLGLPSWVLRVLGARLDRWLPHRADHVIAVSERIRRSLIERTGMSQDRISLIPSGVEADHFSAAAAARLARTKNSGRILYAGNLAAYQGVELLLHAFQRVAQERDVRLVLVTNSPFDGYEKLANALSVRERIDIIPVSFQRLPGLLSTADVAVNPRTECDGIPQKLLNYMASGLPVVSFEGSATGLENGKTALVVQNQDVPALAEAIVRLLDDPTLARKIGKSAREYVVAKRTWEAAAVRAEAVYDMLLGGVQR